MGILAVVRANRGGEEKARITFTGKVSTEQSEINLGTGKFS